LNIYRESTKNLGDCSIFSAKSHILFNIYIAFCADTLADYLPDGGELSGGKKNAPAYGAHISSSRQAKGESKTASFKLQAALNAAVTQPALWQVRQILTINYLAIDLSVNQVRSTITATPSAPVITPATSLPMNSVQPTACNAPATASASPVQLSLLCLAFFEAIRITTFIQFRYCHHILIPRVL
jgi:hypothetical protein